jgi:hypothetical protein
MSAILSRTVAALALTISLGSANAQVSPGTPSVATQPTFQSGHGPVIAIDEAHKNTHTFGSPPFRGLVQLLQADGYRVRPMTETVSDSSLVEIDVLLISQPGGWFGPDESLNEQEVSRLLEWVREGGSLLLVLDHMPAPRNAARLTRALGIANWENGYTMAAPSDSAPIGPIIFWRGDSFPEGARRVGPTGPGGGIGYQGTDAVLAHHVVTDGHRGLQQVRRVVTFIGSAFQPPEGADVLLTLPRNAISFTPTITPDERPVITAATPRTSVGGWAQGAVMTIGRGRVAVFGETGLFSGGPAGDNRVFVLNLLHWLSGLRLGLVRPPNVELNLTRALGQRLARELHAGTAGRVTASR